MGGVYRKIAFELDKSEAIRYDKKGKFWHVVNTHRCDIVLAT